MFFRGARTSAVEWRGVKCRFWLRSVIVSTNKILPPEVSPVKLYVAADSFLSCRGFGQRAPSFYKDFRCVGFFLRSSPFLTFFCASLPATSSLHIYIYIYTYKQRHFNANKAKTEARRSCLKRYKTRCTPVKRGRKVPKESTNISLGFFGS